ncbi:MAG: trypsin-like peptidase domain-containing protein [Caldilineaceae bacterium]
MPGQEHLDRGVVENTLPAVVQIVALRQGFMGNLSSAWTGSGTIVDPRGIILTNCHVANPRAMGMPAPPADKLAVAITERSDEPPVLTFIAEIVQQSPQMDLAVLQIVSRVDGKAASNLNLPHLPLGDSDALELGDILSIFGYPGIGGETVTFTSGSVSGFTRQEDITKGRAWIKTDATIAGGNSGGTAVNTAGELVGIPTQAAAGTNVSPVDARPVVDTNRDGRIDDRDTPMAIGGFINGLRPINLAKPLLQKAGVGNTSRRRSAPAAAPAPNEEPEAKKSGGLKSLRKGKASPAPSKKAGPQFTNLVFSDQVARDGRPINPTAMLSGERKQVFASFEFAGMENGVDWGQAWAIDGKTALQDAGKWSDGESGRKTIVLSSRNDLPDGKYHLVLTVGKQVLAQGEVTVGRQVDDTDTEISGQVIDKETNKGIAGALVIALKSGVRASDFVREQRQDMAFTSTKTDRNGRFTFVKQLPKGQSYGLIVVARGYRDMAIESALRISPQSPEQAQIYPIPMIEE